jgi:hypothetical protein
MTKKDESLSLGSHRRPGSPSSAASTVRRRQRPALYDTGHGKLTGSPDRPDQASRAEAKAQRNMAAEEPASRSHYGRQPLATTVSVARTGDYEVGYRKPPVHTRFKKGQSGNPRGRKKSSKNIRKIVN